MDLRRLHDYPEHPEPDGHDAEFNREERPRSHPVSVAVTGVAALVLVLTLPFVLFGTELKQLWHSDVKLGDLLNTSEVFRSMILVVAAAVVLALVLFIARAFRSPLPRDPEETNH